jgi:hypothetical protein
MLDQRRKAMLDFAPVTCGGDDPPLAVFRQFEISARETSHEPLALAKKFERGDDSECALRRLRTTDLGLWSLKIWLKCAGGTSDSKASRPRTGGSKESARIPGEAYSESISD